MQLEKPQKWGYDLFLAVASVNYIYKMIAAIALIPLLYAARKAIFWYLGKEQAEHLHHIAHSNPLTKE